MRFAAIEERFLIAQPPLGMTVFLSTPNDRTTLGAGPFPTLDKLSRNFVLLEFVSLV